MTMKKDYHRPLALIAGLLVRLWPQLLLNGTVRYSTRDLLLDATVTVGLRIPTRRYDGAVADGAGGASRG